jgi:hypothetical protein
MDQIKLTVELLAEGMGLSRAGSDGSRGRGTADQAWRIRVHARESLERREQHRRLIAATLRQTSVDAAVSHMSAAVLHQLPIWNNQLARVHITRDGSGGGKYAAMSIFMSPHC